MCFGFSYFFWGEVLHDRCAGRSPLSVKNRGGAVIGYVRLIRRIRYVDF